jgi:hypothetical protein
MRVLASTPFSRRFRMLVSSWIFTRRTRSFSHTLFTFCRVAHSRLCQTRAFGFVNLPARCRVASHALLCHRSYAECHTAQVVSRDVGFRPAMPLPAVAILLRALLSSAPTCISQGVNGVRLFEHHCISFYRRTQLGEWRSFLVSFLAPTVTAFWALANARLQALLRAPP